MKIVIVGGGKVGNAICKELEEYCDIVLIDSDPDVVEMAFSQYDIQAVVGNGADVNIQREATVQNADIFLAVTSSDELNLVSCIVAKELGVKYIIARVRDPEYRNSVDFIRDRLGITAVINPEEEAAKKNSSNHAISYSFGYRNICGRSSPSCICINRRKYFFERSHLKGIR